MEVFVIKMVGFEIGFLFLYKRKYFKLDDVFFFDKSEK